MSRPGGDGGLRGADGHAAGPVLLLLLGWFAVGALLGNRPPLHVAVLAVTLLAIVWCAISVFWDAPGPH
ncbi:hypothetical protein [Streptomyces sp. NPDC005012]|uniref:hypothetical protein n=1 Tax=Streptomyces sp. NPDC005012 TaxID=3154558 RepID=UPI0033BA469A